MTNNRTWAKRACPGWIWAGRTLAMRTCSERTGANLSGANLSDVDLGAADLSGANLRKANLIDADLSFADLSDADLRAADLIGANLRGAYLSNADLREAGLHEADVRETGLNGANLFRVDLSDADLRDADLSGANLSEANLIDADLREADLSKTDLSETDLSEADLSGSSLYDADLRKATLSGVDLSWADLRGADLSGADLTRAALVETNLDAVNLSSASVCGTSVWNVKGVPAAQTDLTITESGEAEVTVDDLKIAQFIHLLLTNAEIRNVIDTVARKAVLILGRFTLERKAILDMLRVALRDHNYAPILFDFSKPDTRDLTETVRTLAHMSRFIIADITDPSSIPQELQAIVPDLAVPVVPILSGDAPYTMFVDLQRKYHWVLDIHRYDSQQQLLDSLMAGVITPAEAKAQELSPVKNTNST